MYSFIIISVSLFLLTGVVFKKKLGQNKFAMYSIIVIGSLIGTTITNGILSSNIPYSKVLRKEKELTNKYSDLVILKKDTVIDTVKIELPFKYVHYYDSSKRYMKNYIKLYVVDGVFDTTEFNYIKFTLVNDSIPKLKIYKNRKIIDSNWITSFGLPSKGDKSYEVLIPNNEENKEYIRLINLNYFKNEEKL